MMNSYHRSHRLLLDTKPGGAPPRFSGREAKFDSNMVIILATLLCGLICVLLINTIVRCMLRCAGRMNLDTAEEAPPRFGGMGLNKTELRQIPVAVYGSGEGVGCTDCAICLGEFMDGEKIRVLPKCHHCFHVKCVDVWLAGNSSCPTCRGLVTEEIGGGDSGEVVIEFSGLGDGEWVGRDGDHEPAF